MNAIVKYLLDLIIGYMESHPVFLQRTKERLGFGSGAVFSTGRGIAGEIISVEDINEDCVIVLQEGTTEEDARALSEFFEALGDNKKRIIIASDKLSVVRF